MARPKLNKTRIHVNIDKELKDIIDKKNINLSAYINQLLYKDLLLNAYDLNPNSSVSSLPSHQHLGVPGSSPGGRMFIFETSDLGLEFRG
jgi:hypothetical protein